MLGIRLPRPPGSFTNLCLFDTLHSRWRPDFRSIPHGPFLGLRCFQRRRAIGSPPVFFDCWFFFGNAHPPPPLTAFPSESGGSHALSRFYLLQHPVDGSLSPSASFCLRLCYAAPVQVATRSLAASLPVECGEPASFIYNVRRAQGRDCVDSRVYPRFI